MSSRFLSNTVLSLAGGFAVVASIAWAPTTFTWLMLGVGIIAVALSVTALAPRRGTAQRGLDLATAGVGAWTIVASLVFTGSLVTWLGFAAGAALVGLALVGLALHELSTERVVHSLEVRRTAPEPEFATING